MWPPWRSHVVDHHLAEAGARHLGRAVEEAGEVVGDLLRENRLLHRLDDQVGGIGIAPGANMSDSVAMFEATHGTAPKYAGQDKVNPGSLILSGEMMFRHLGWNEAADLIVSSMEATILDKRVTYDFARLMDDATEVSTSGFGRAMIERM